MKLVARAYKDYKEYMTKLQAWEESKDVMAIEDEDLFPKPEPEFVYITVAFRDADVLDYSIREAKDSEFGIKEIEIARMGFDGVVVMVTDYSEEIEKKLDEILGIHNKLFRDGD